nr:response regulator transcription factor [uncultured Desulfuromonas sp.]
MNKNILIVEDEEDILALVHYNLSRDGFQVTTATTGEDGVEQARKEHPDLMILDLMLPGMDGLEVCETLKKDRELRDIPIIMLTAKGEESDIVKGLEMGAADYVTKPFSPKVLLARVKAVLRRYEQGDDAEHIPTDAVIERHGLVIHPGRNEVLVDGRSVDLTYTEFRVLHFLASRPGWVFTRYQIVNAVRGEDYSVTDRAVDVQIVGLRRKLGNFGHCIETVRGVGYRFKD